MRISRHLVALTLVGVLAACGGTTDDVDPGAEGDGTTTEAPADDTGDDMADETSEPADEDAVQQAPTSVTQGEAEAIGNAYLGLTRADVEEQAAIDDRDWRIGAEDGEQMMLTEDYVVGRITVTLESDVVTEVVVEATDGPVTIS